MPVLLFQLFLIHYLRFLSLIARKFYDLKRYFNVERSPESICLIPGMHFKLFLKKLEMVASMQTLRNGKHEWKSESLNLLKIVHL